ncbi:DNA/RNA-binding protein [Phytophthora fragariae]|uniref:DNA/RNA-binding protein n=1 Tax=Phytophthora fragariae TaxID=53985 RepID=A0A6A3UJ67_9STRA|nr:DNA/RNA-binding protein [Phytophthora fragariae]
MGKHDFLTPKAIGIRMKSKGLQKLRWFCQVCQKQCRDENGFKCHTTSEAHQRQMLLVANDPNKFMRGYSDMFEEAFLENLRRRHGTKRMRATHVYNEYIQHKLHVHMNATQWETLGSFVQYLGRTGKCVVDETEKGWHVQYIDRDPRALARQQELDKKKKAELDHEERNRLFLERQLKLASEKEGADTQQRPTKLQRGEDGEQIKMAIGGGKVAGKKESGSRKADAFGDAGSKVFGGERKEKHRDEEFDSKRAGKRHAVDAIMEEEERRKKDKKRRLEDESERQRKENWVTTGIVVKVTNRKVGDGRYYKCKGVVKGVEDKFCATVELLDSADVLRLDQDDLETVIPKPGRKVKVVNGLGRGCIAKLLDISVDDFCARIRIDSGSHKGEVLDRVEYEDICRLAEE